MKRFGNATWFFVRLVLVVALGVATMVGAVVGMAPSVAKLKTAASSFPPDVTLPPLGGTSIVYDRYGNAQQSFNREIRDVVPLSSIPQSVIQSVLAVEDSDFYRHGPVNARSILRALQTNVQEGGAERGGSTITQQVVKGALIGDQRTLERKLSEAQRASELERQYTKDEILAYYLNMVYFGNNIYGVQAAAKTYWNVDVDQLNWAQAALLAALIRSPNSYEPIRHPVNARKQRSIALGRLVASGRLSPEDAAKARKEPLPDRLYQTVPVRDYFVEEVRRRLLNKDGAYDNTPEGFALGDTYEKRYDALNRGALRIYTTYDPGLQAKAVEARRQTVPNIQDDGRIPRPDYIIPEGSPDAGKAVPQWATATIVSVEPATGAVRMLLGGPNYTSSTQQNIATQSYQQPGSSFKTFVLAEAFEKGYVPNDSINGASPCTLTANDPNYINPTRPAEGVLPFTLRNYGGGGGSSGTLTMQTTTSSNCGFARLGQIAGLRDVVNLAHNMGISNPTYNAPDPTGKFPNWMNPYSVVQAYGGTNGVFSLDMAAAYATIANDGVQNDAYLVDRIEDAQGNVIWTHRLTPNRVMKAQTARLVTQVLEKNVQGGTGTAARLGAQPAAGKTGTTTSAKDLWFVGYTPQLATAVWIGDGGTHKSPMFGTSATGGTYAARTWGAYMRAALADAPVEDFIEADPTRPGIGIRNGPEDGMTFAARYGKRAVKPAPPTKEDDQRSTSGTTSVPPTTAPPITSYQPEP